MDRLHNFHYNSKLKIIRLYNSPVVPRNVVDKEYSKRKTYLLCSSTTQNGQKQTARKICKTCGVPLCVEPIYNVICCKECHNTTNLMECHCLDNECLFRIRQSNHNSDQSIAPRNAHRKQKKAPHNDSSESSKLLPNLSILTHYESTGGQ